MIKTLVITDQEDYEAVKARVDKASEMLEGKWADPKYRRWVDKYNMLASATFDWEMVSGIFEREFDKFCRELDANNRRTRTMRNTEEYGTIRQKRVSEEDLVDYSNYENN